MRVEGDGGRTVEGGREGMRVERRREGGDEGGAGE